MTKSNAVFHFSDSDISRVKELIPNDAELHSLLDAHNVDAGFKLIDYIRELSSITTSLMSAVEFARRSDL